jgi:hypothetical protein
MCEAPLIEALDEYIESGHRNERQLARLCKDLIHLTGDQQIVIRYINMQASKVLEEESAWD